jgi:hypothetical protein
LGHRFSATIFKAGINPCVDVPLEVSAALGKNGYIPVCGTLNGHAFQAGLVSLGHGRHRLFINGQMRKLAGVDAGDTVALELEYDPEPRRVAAPPALQDALAADPAVAAAWERLTPSKRKEVLSYLNWLKRPESLHRNVDKVVALLRAGRAP